MKSFTVTMRHLAAAKICAARREAYFRLIGWDWEDFKQNGRSIEEVEAIGDALSAEVARVARGIES